MAWDLGFRVSSFGFRVWGLGFRVLGFGFRVLGSGVSKRVTNNEVPGALAIEMVIWLWGRHMILRYLDPLDFRLRQTLNPRPSKRSCYSLRHLQFATQMRFRV